MAKLGIVLGDYNNGQEDIDPEFATWHDSTFFEVGDNHDIDENLDFNNNFDIEDSFWLWV